MFMTVNSMNLLKAVNTHRIFSSLEEALSFVGARSQRKLYHNRQGETL